MSDDAALGRHGEDLAHRYLQRSGLCVIARNYRPRGGDAEVDLVARDGSAVVFVEVKTRRSADFGSPDRAIGDRKQENIVRAARAFAQRGEIPWNQVRFDTVSIVMSDPPALTHERDAFFHGRAH